MDCPGWDKCKSLMPGSTECKKTLEEIEKE